MTGPRRCTSLGTPPDPSLASATHASLPPSRNSFSSGEIDELEVRVRVCPAVRSARKRRPPAASPIQWKVGTAATATSTTSSGVTRGISWTDADEGPRRSAQRLAPRDHHVSRGERLRLLAGRRQAAVLKIGDGGAPRPGRGSASSVPDSPARSPGSPARRSTTPTGLRASPPAATASRCSRRTRPTVRQWDAIAGTRTDVVSYVIETEQAEDRRGDRGSRRAPDRPASRNIRGFAYSSINISLDRVVSVTFDRGTKRRRRPTSRAAQPPRRRPPIPSHRSAARSRHLQLVPADPGKHDQPRFESPSGRTLTLTRDFVSALRASVGRVRRAGAFDWTGAADACVAGRRRNAGLPSEERVCTARCATLECGVAGPRARHRLRRRRVEPAATARVQRHGDRGGRHDELTRGAPCRRDPVVTCRPSAASAIRTS